MSDGKYYPFMGGHLEEIPAGEAEFVDEQTGQPRKVSWPNHVRVMCKLGKQKLNRAAIEAIASKLENDGDFRAWVEQCP